MMANRSDGGADFDLHGMVDRLAKLWPLGVSVSEYHVWLNDEYGELFVCEQRTAEGFERLINTLEANERKKATDE